MEGATLARPYAEQWDSVRRTKGTGVIGASSSRQPTPDGVIRLFMQGVIRSGTDRVRQPCIESALAFDARGEWRNSVCRIILLLLFNTLEYDTASQFHDHDIISMRTATT